jgi:hypothetical protein
MQVGRVVALWHTNHYDSSIISKTYVCVRSFNDAHFEEWWRADLRAGRLSQPLLGSPELVETVDKGDVSVSAATRLARGPAEQQRKAVKAPTVVAKRAPAANRSGSRSAQDLRPEV